MLFEILQYLALILAKRGSVYSVQSITSCKYHKKIMKCFKKDATNLQCTIVLQHMISRIVLYCRRKYSRPPVIWPSFIQNLGIENDCSIRVFRLKMCVLLEYFNGALYINVRASIIRTIHLSEHFYNFLRPREFG